MVWEGLSAACASTARSQNAFWSEFKCQSHSQLEPHHQTGTPNFQVPPVISIQVSISHIMPLQKTKRAPTGVQQSLKSTWTNSTRKATAPGEKKTTVRVSSDVVSPIPPAPKRIVKKKQSITDESSAEESEIESFSSVASDKEDVSIIHSCYACQHVLQRRLFRSSLSTPSKK